MTSHQNKAKPPPFAVPNVMHVSPMDGLAHTVGTAQITVHKSHVSTNDDDTTKWKVTDQNP